MQAVVKVEVEREVKERGSEEVDALGEGIYWSANGGSEWYEVGGRCNRVPMEVNSKAGKSSQGQRGELLLLVD